MYLPIMDQWLESWEKNELILPQDANPNISPLSKNFTLPIILVYDFEEESPWQTTFHQGLRSDMEI